ncbi:MAG: hypothetical protein SCM96_02440 [Acidobacteriota bacterium]|nr:hypothetical protein [Acidobacteriota bacterium]
MKALFFKVVAGLMLVLVLFSASTFSSQDALPELKVKAATRETLAAVYDEVKDMPAYPDEPFIRMDVFIGEDDDDTNKDIHAVLLVAKEHGHPALRVQIVFMERRRGFPVIRIARETKSFLCVFENGGLDVRSTTFTAADIDGLAPGLLKAVRDKKRILGKASSGRSAE